MGNKIIAFIYLTKDATYGKTNSMIPLIKKWWFLQQVGKQLRFHTLTSSLEDISKGSKIVLSQEFLIVGNDAFSGIAHKSLKRFSSIFWWKRKENPEKLKNKIAEYNDIFESCINDEYLKFVDHHMVARGPRYDDVHGFSGLIELLGTKRKFYLSIIWGIVGPIAVLVYYNWNSIKHWLKAWLQ